MKMKKLNYKTNTNNFAFMNNDQLWLKSCFLRNSKKSSNNLKSVKNLRHEIVFEPRLCEQEAIMARKCYSGW